MELAIEEYLYCKPIVAGRFGLLYLNLDIDIVVIQSEWASDPA
jgi:hypothetical protein